ncbi:MAG TPA: hypothetical protein VE687_09195 [Stellaceae bacterium]|nr:hypothetical protein [Stellaceae bacterium]
MAAILPASPGVIWPPASAAVTAFIAAAMSAALSIGGNANLTVRSRHGGRRRSRQSRIAVGSPASRDRFVAAVTRARINGKPVIAMKVGGSTVGAAAAASHTASLAGSDAIYDAAFRQLGIERAVSPEDLVEIALRARADDCRVRAVLR